MTTIIMVNSCGWALPIQHRSKVLKSPQVIIKEIADKYGVKVVSILSRNRKRELVNIRAEIAVLLSEQGLSSTQIGKLLNRNHTTVLHWLGRTEKGKHYAKKYNR